MKPGRKILLVSGAIFSILGLALLAQWLDPLVSGIVSRLMSSPAKPTWPIRYHQVGAGLLGLGLVALLCALWILPHKAALIAGVRKFGQGLDGWLDRRLGRWIDFSGDKAPARFTWPRLSWVDGVVCAGFLVYALLIFIGSIQGNFPNIMLGGDEANTASFAAGFDHPALFQGDMLLGQTSNFAAYSTFNVAFMRWLAPLAGSYSLALAILIPIQIFFYLAGFYFFGRVLFRQRGWALLLTCLVSYSVVLNAGEGWGVSLSPAARAQFMAALPFLLGMLLIWKNQPARWPWIMAATGLLIYLHPISTPAWAVAIWLTLWVSAPREWSLIKKFGVLFGMGCIFLVAAAPYVATYLSNHTQGNSADYNLVMYIFANFMPPNILEVPGYFSDYLRAIAGSGLLALALVGLAATLLIQRKRLATAGLVLLWMGGILAVSVGLPWLTLNAQRILHVSPTVSELVRGVRYLIPWLLLFCVWPFAELSQRARSKATAGVFAVAGLAFTLAWGIASPQATSAIQQGLACVQQGRLVCPQVTDYDRILQVVKEKTPPGAPLYATFANDTARSYGMPLRFIALRPLVYSYKDRGLLVYTNDQALQQWFAAYVALERIEQTFTSGSERVSLAPAERLNRHIQLARELGARYILTDFKTDLPALGIASVTEIASNPGFTLLEIK